MQTASASSHQTRRRKKRAPRARCLSLHYLSPRAFISRNRRHTSNSRSAINLANNKPVERDERARVKRSHAAQAGHKARNALIRFARPTRLPSPASTDRPAIKRGSPYIGRDRERAALLALLHDRGIMVARSPAASIR